MTTQLNEKMKTNLLDLCRTIAGSRRITASCLYGPWICGYADIKTDINVLMILEQFNFRLNTYFEKIDDVNVSILTLIIQISKGM